MDFEEYQMMKDTTFWSILKFTWETLFGDKLFGIFFGLLFFILSPVIYARIRWDLYKFKKDYPEYFL